ncbi:LacI family DNA-binding transcriptional regulator [Microlunatus sp. GCM10028923]|uniref:LacI family DNA-binding transcriptional regulator n=1 Tax=Microlunatus sp. GCM10028923 TaxID=3273400 RepID=UPI00360F7D74
MADRGPEAATIYSVAQRAGVSIATVSRVLRGVDTASVKTRDKVMAAAAELDYAPQNSARSLASKRHRAYAVLMSDTTGPYYSELLMGFEAVASTADESVIVVTSTPDLDAAAMLTNLRGRVDGVMIAPSAADEATQAKIINALPTVLVGMFPLPGSDLVISESTTHAAELTRHLLVDHGRRDLLFVGEPDGAADVRARFDGFQAAHAELGVRPKAPLLTHGANEAIGLAMVDKIFRRRAGIDALVCANDELALSIMYGLRLRGLSIPDELAVVGWDDVPTARYVEPGLTTVRQPVREMGARAAEVLRDRLAGTPVGEPHQLPTELIIRASCGCPPRNFLSLDSPQEQAGTARRPRQTRRTAASEPKRKRS